MVDFAAQVLRFEGIASSRVTRELAKGEGEFLRVLERVLYRTEPLQNGRVSLFTLLTDRLKVLNQLAPSRFLNARSELQDISAGLEGSPQQIWDGHLSSGTRT